MVKICVLEHAEPETPGLLGEVLTARGIRMDTVQPYRGEPVPRGMEGFSGLLVMGGPMAVYEADRFPWIRDELALIETALAEEKPILGICLGSQLLASALGAMVAPGNREIGWLPVSLAAEAERDPLWGDVDRSFHALHWHGDAYALPHGAVHLASSALTPIQAFRYGSAAYGLLFHMEMTEAMIRGMVRAFDGELRRAGADGGAILARAPFLIPPMHAIARRVFDRWAAVIAPAEGGE
jgi:GMP synthase (glutamine-hydrolysing)